MSRRLRRSMRGMHLLQQGEPSLDSSLGERALIALAWAFVLAMTTWSVGLVIQLLAAYAETRP